MKYGQRQSLEKQITLAGPDRYQEPTGFQENFQAAVGLTMLDGLSWSGAFWHDYNEDNRKKLVGLLDSGAVTREEVDRYRMNQFDPSLDMDRVATYLQQEKGIQDILTNDQIREKNNIQEEELLGYGRSVQANANSFGKIGGFLGTIPAYALDPYFSASLLIPVGHAARGASLLTRSLIAAGKTAATEGGLELARQPMIYAWRRELGRDYSIKEGLAEVAMATVGAGFLGGAAELAKGIRKFRNKAPIRSSEDGIVAKELDDLADILEKAPEEGLNAETHIARLQDEIDYINGDKRVRVANELLEPSKEVSARAEPSPREIDFSNSPHFEEAFEELLAKVPSEVAGMEIKDLSAHLDIISEGGELIVKTKPLREAVTDMKNLNENFQTAFDCLFRMAG